MKLNLPQFAAISLLIPPLLASDPSSGLISNGSFESGLDGWSATGNLRIETAIPYVATDGNALIAFNSGNLTANATLAQSFATIPRRNYVIEFDAGILMYKKISQTMEVTLTGSDSLLSKTITIESVKGQTIRWLPQSFTFTADSNSTTVTFHDKSGTTASIDLLLDNVRIRNRPNTAPIAVADSYTTIRENPLVISASGVLGNDIDAESDSQTALLDSQPTHGTVILNQNGSFTYTPAPDYVGQDTFSYHSHDGEFDSNTVAVSISIFAESEVWKALYGTQSLPGMEDADHDGETNAAEAIAGTDPFDHRSRLRVVAGGLSGNEFQMDVSSQPGKCYQVFTSSNPTGSWTPHGTPVIASGENLRIMAPRLGVSGFYRVGVSDRDSDTDGLTDWDELQLPGFDPNNSDSFSSGIPGNDLATSNEILRAENLAITVPTPTAFENDATHAIVTFTRSTALDYPMPVFLRIGGSSNPTKSSASSNDFLLQDAAGAPVKLRLTIPAGQSSADLHFIPLADTLREVPEEVQVAIGSNRSATVTIRDAAPTLANQTYLLANLGPIFGTGSVGSGKAVIRLPGDNDIATIILSFSNLKSPVSSADIQAEDTAVLQSVPAANYTNHVWPIRACGGFPTDQSLLDALLTSAVGIYIKTTSHPQGEVKGTFMPTRGSTEYLPPPSPVPIEQLTGEELDHDIVRFLTQATFGPTTADIGELRNLVASHSGDRISAFGEWIDRQFSLPSPSLLEYVRAADRQEIEVSAALPPDHPNYRANFDPGHHNRIRGWWFLARHAPDQLRQRAAFALSEVFVVSDCDPLLLYRPYGLAHFYDTLRVGSSGTYRGLLEGVAKHPVMGQYLSHLRNEKAVLDEMGNTIVSPDENFAREIMQLFSIGLVELHPDGSPKLSQDGLPIPTYGQDDITGIARALTGWSFSVFNSPPTSDNTLDNTNFNCGNGITRYEAQWLHPMKVFQTYHDADTKTFLGVTIPAGQTGDQDLADVLDRLASHSNTAPFISRRLIQRLVTANPSASYLSRVSSAFTSSGGNLATTIKAILLDPEARSVDAALGVSGFGKKKEPILRFLSFVRAFDGKTGLLLSDLTPYGYPISELAKFPLGTTRLRLGTTDYWLSQSPQSAPSVFNWYPPDHVPSGILAINGLASPEMKEANEYSVFQETNLHYYLIFGYLTTGIIPGQDLPPHSYSATAHHLTIDFAPLEAIYLTTMDTNGDGFITALDSTTFNNPTAIATACEAVIDHIDLLLCAGALKTRYDDISGQPRRTIIEAVTSIRSGANSENLAVTQATSMRLRIQNALWLVMSSPDFVIQK